MKNAVTFRNCSRVVLPLAGALMVLGFTGWAEDKAPGPPEATVKSAARHIDYSLEIERGRIVQPPSQSGQEAKLKNILNVLREAYLNANIVAAPGVADLVIEDLKLRALSLPEALDALRVASGNKFAWQSAEPPQQGNIDAATGRPTAASYVGLYALSEPAPTPDTYRTVAAFNLTSYLGEQLNGRSDRLKQVQEIVSEALKPLSPPNTPPAEFQFHAGACLLVVIGTREQLDAARNVINALVKGDDDVEGVKEAGGVAGAVLNGFLKGLGGAGEAGKPLSPQYDLGEFKKALEAQKILGESGAAVPKPPAPPAPGTPPAAPR
jgi:hypothetical protein